MLILHLQHHRYAVSNAAPKIHQALPLTCCDPSDSHEACSKPAYPPIDQYPCPECRQLFTQKTSLEAHQRKSLHAYCFDCGIIVLLSGWAIFQCWSRGYQMKCSDLQLPIPGGFRSSVHDFLPCRRPPA
ncbi:uncharacterized protein K444DRAFT_71204 [Hyaloscypha bicolor E]|uniref:C2H2-type domain-containing protein n=1 Tax=Hyaloscypha bicolor E TaxID=1095630 RepID=A0A2J6T119_9HELO|nr:uncharacterized protein K444DRAFT_71204 [Hyaloscypha bicolor E]PMD56699.1 hypothetical protein K444DRAFT_71204 [Hyaloscypha bicolor E]